MAVLHASGLSWISGEIANSNAEDFLKDVFPVLFIHVSIQLFGLASLGILAIFLGQAARKVLIFLSVMVIANVGLAIYLGAIAPGVLLLTAALLFLLAAIKASK